MSRYEIVKIIKDLACSQGFYGRLLERIEENEEILDYLEKQNFKDIIDMIMFIEC